MRLQITRKSIHMLTFVGTLHVGMTWRSLTAHIWRLHA